MIIFIQDLSDSTTRAELNTFITQDLNRAQLIPFLKRGKLEMSDIIRIKDLDTGKVEYHGLAYIDDAMEGETLVKHLNGCRLSGKTMKVREYFPRNHRERRVSPEKEQLAIVDRRRLDRRRKNLRIETLYGSQPDSAQPAA